MTDFAVRKFFEIEKDFEHSQKLSVADFNFISKELRDAWRFNYRAGYIDALQDHGSWYLGVQRAVASLNAS